MARRAHAHVQEGARAAEAACRTLGQILATRFGGEVARVNLVGYMPMRSEIDPRAAMQAHPGQVGVPVIAALHHPLVFHRWTPDMPMVPGLFGANVPARAEPIAPQVLIVPMLAFDPRGFRLGYGGGFYDRTLAQLRASGDVLAIGLAYSAQEQAEVPIEPTDETLDMIVTERATHDFST